MMMCSECPTVFVDAETVSFTWRLIINTKSDGTIPWMSYVKEFRILKCVNAYFLDYEYLAKYNSSILYAVTYNYFWFWPLPALTHHRVLDWESKKSRSRDLYFSQFLKKIG